MIEIANRDDVDERHANVALQQCRDVADESSPALGTNSVTWTGKEFDRRIEANRRLDVTLIVDPHLRIRPGRAMVLKERQSVDYPVAARVGPRSISAPPTPGIGARDQGSMPGFKGRNIDSRTRDQEARRMPRRASQARCDRARFRTITAATCRPNRPRNDVFRSRWAESEDARGSGTRKQRLPLRASVPRFRARVIQRVVSASRNDKKRHDKNEGLSIVRMSPFCCSVPWRKCIPKKWHKCVFYAELLLNPRPHSQGM